MTDDLGLTETIENLCDRIVKEMTRKELENIVWDSLYTNFTDMSLEDLMATAEYYGIDANTL